MILKYSDFIKERFEDVRQQPLSNENFLNMLKSLKRYDIDTADNGEFIEQIEREEEDGKYVKADDIETLIIQLAKTL